MGGEGMGASFSFSREGVGPGKLRAQAPHEGRLFVKAFVHTRYVLTL